MPRTPCSVKRSYASEEDALRHLVECIEARMKGVERRREATVYECPRCGGWHLTEWLQTKGSDTQLTEQQHLQAIRALQMRHQVSTLRRR